MNTKDMLDAIKKSLCSGVEIEEKGIDRYVIHTDFTYPDGDELRIILKKQDGEWLFTDEGHTLMWLSYENFNLKTDTRSDLFFRTLSSNHAVLEDGRICIRFETGRIRGAIHSMIQALIQTADLLYMDRENVRSTFIEDLQAVFRGRVDMRDVETNKVIKNQKGEEYLIDVYVKGSEGMDPLLVFAVSNKDKCKDAAMAMITLAAEDKMQFTSLAVIDSMAEIPPSDRDKLINRADKTYIGLSEMNAGLERFLKKNNYAEV